MKEKQEKTSRGGARAGAGRKKTAVKQCAFYATAEVAAILENVQGSKSEFINRCILFAHGNVCHGKIIS